MSEFPTADDIARAIVAACRETGDDPLACASGAPSQRGRHYAMHALLHVFPKLSRTSAATVVGCPGKPAAFYINSWHQMVKPRASGIGHMANWWDDEAFGRVIAAVESGRGRPVKPFRIADRLTTRIAALPRGLVNVNHLVFNDPPPGRSALDQKREEGTP